MFFTEEAEVKEAYLEQVWREYEILTDHILHDAMWGTPCGPTLEMVVF